MPRTPSTPASADRKNFAHYLPIPDKIFHAGIHVVGAGHREVHSGEGYLEGLGRSHPTLYQFNWREGRILPDFAFLLVEAGRGHFDSPPTGPMSISAGMGIILFPGVLHRFRPGKETGWTLSWITFNGEFAHLLWDEGIISPERAVIHPASLEATKTAFHQLLDLVHAHPSSNSLLHSMHVMGLLATLGDLPVSQIKDATEQSVAAAALATIWTSSHRLLSVNDVAGAIGVTRRKLERGMAEELGRSVLDEITNCRYSRAVRLLRETQLPLKVVANLAGFGSIQSMRRTIEKRTGLAPADYRRKHGISSAP